VEAAPFGAWRGLASVAMVAEVSDAHLQRFVVRIEVPDGSQTLGTGVLIAPGWVLTCAHVVDELSQVRIVRQVAASVGAAAAAAVSALGEVRARSTLRDPLSGSVFWPFPDLALVAFDGWAGHLFAPLVAAEPVRTQQSHAWGFGRRERGVTPVGSPASFRYVGREGDGFLSLQAGDAPPGLSGAPLLCPVRRAVVGVMSVSRDPNDARGGWAAPAAAVAGGPEVADELAALGAQVLAANRARVWEHREAWSSVLPVVHGALGVDQPWDQLWEGFELGAGVAPSVMLRAEFQTGVLPYFFRETALAEAQRWCQGPARVALSYLDAPGGAGKTRFAIELCRVMAGTGWVAGFLPRRDRGIAAVAAPRLLVLDYVEERQAAELTERLAELTRSATVMEPVRVLLLSRPTPGQRRTVSLSLSQQPGASGAVLAALETARHDRGAVAELTMPQRAQLFTTALGVFGRRWHGPRWTPPTAVPDLGADRYALALDVLLEAFDAALSGPSWRSGRPPVERVLDHEQRHWHARARDLGEPKILRLCVGLATVAGARDDREAGDLLALIPRPAGVSGGEAGGRIDGWLSQLYHGPDRWNALIPDRLGEALIARVFGDQDDGGRTLLLALLDLRSDEQLARVLDVSARLASDPGPRGMIAATLTHRHSALVERASRQARGSHTRPGRVDLLQSVLRLHTAVLTDELVTALPPATQALLSASFDQLGKLAREHGYTHDARLLFECALRIDKRKFELEPTNPGYRRDLSISYERLADVARAAGRSGEAEGLYRQSLQVAEELVELEPANPGYRRDLSISYERLADVARAAGRLDEATSCAGAAVRLRRTVHHQEPTREDLAVEFAYSLYLNAQVAEASGQRDATYRDQHELIQALQPFESKGLLGQRGRGLLRWARESLPPTTDT
jgi:tetratricopeptide (TPR) repeat protein